MMKNLLIFVFMLLDLVVHLSNGFTYQKVHRSTEICGTHNGHRRYLELGETGEILAQNISVPSYVQEVSKQFNQSLTMQCTLELVTCTSCSIRLKFDYINFLSNCPNPKNGAGICRCDYLILSEPPYDDKQKNLVHNCGQIFEYQTKTRTLSIKFIYWNNYTDAFRIEYTVEQNREIIASSSPIDSSESRNQDSYEIQSPFFPAYYPRDYATEHIIKCDFELCRIRIEFSDFLISRSSSMEFIDTSGERFYVTGKNFRPPFLISSGSSVTVRFNANGQSDLGYKAKIWFISQNDVPTLPAPQTNCGGLVDTIGGVITMMNMSGKDLNESSSVLYDCIWIIKPPEAYLQIKSHISIKVETFEKMSSDSEIQIHQGMTSDKPVIELLRASPGLSSVSSRNLIAPLSAGFYVRLRGSFTSLSRLAIVYAAFSYSKCYPGNEFMCQNQRCINLMLQCDGFDHCGDNSDEPESCSEVWENSLIDRRWYSHTPNYYFPKLERFPDFGPTTVAFGISAMSLLLVISCLILMIHRNGNRVREQEELQNQLQTISQLLDANNNNNRPDEILEPPPIYENPPDYDDIIKIGMDEQINRARRERRSGRRSRLHRPRRSDPAVSVQRSLLEVAALEESDLPSTSSLASGSTFYTNNELRENFPMAFQRLDVEEEIAASASNGSIHSIPGLIQTDIPVSNNENQKTELQKSPDDPISTATSPSLDMYSSSQPRHLWSDESKYKKSWILFSSDEYSTKLPKYTSSVINPQPYDSIDIAQMQEVDDYFKSYAVSKAFFQPSQSEDSFVSMKSCFCDSQQSIFSDKFKTSLLTNKTECDCCKNIIYQSQNRRCSVCGDCVAKLYSPKICITCNGRISFQDLKNVSIKHQNTNGDHIEEVIGVKLCNCFPKYPSQNFSSIQSNDINEIQVLPKISGKSCSYNEIVHQSKRRKNTQYFGSHNCLPIKTSSSDDDSSDEE